MSLNAGPNRQSWRSHAPLALPGPLPAMAPTHNDGTWHGPSRIVAVGSAPIQHHVRERRELTGNNRHNAEVPHRCRLVPTCHQFDRQIPRQIGTDLRKRTKGRYLSSCRAMTMRWIWLVPS